MFTFYMKQLFINIEHVFLLPLHGVILLRVNILPSFSQKYYQGKVNYLTSFSPPFFLKITLNIAYIKN